MYERNTVCRVIFAPHVIFALLNCFRFVLIESWIQQHIVLLKKTNLRVELPSLKITRWQRGQKWLKSTVGEFFACIQYSKLPKLVFIPRTHCPSQFFLDILEWNRNTCISSLNNIARPILNISLTFFPFLGFVISLNKSRKYTAKAVVCHR